MTVDPKKRPPGPKGMESVKFLLSVRTNFIEAFDATRKQYGDVFYYKFQGKEWFVFSSASSAQRILKDNIDNYSKDIPRWLLGDIMGEGLVLTQGQKWREQRKTVASTFHPKNVETMIPKVITLARAFGEQNKNKQVNISAVMNWLSMQVAASCFLGEDLSQDEMVIINEYLPEYSDLAALKLQDPTRNAEWLPTPKNLRAKKLRRALNQISERLATSGEKQELSLNNIITNILKSAKAEKIKVTPKELQHQIFTFLAAGHETTSNLLNWTLYLLDRNPKVQSKIRDEVRSFDEDNITSESLQGLVYLEAVIKESLRLYPPVPSLVRVAKEEDEIDGHYIPKGAIVPAFQYLVQRNESYWPDAERFEPSRFLDPDFKKSYTPFSYFPFSGGPRQCIGEGFAYIEAKIILAHFLKHYKFEISNSQNIGSQAAVTLRPRPDLMGHFRAL